MTDATLDLQQVRREIEADVRARRASGEYPADFEYELDAIFARLAPPDVATDLDAALERVDELIMIEPSIPTASRKPGIGALKRVIAKLIGWYHAFVAQQVTELGVAISQTLRILRDRVDEIERDTGDAARARTEGARIGADRDDGAWAEIVVAAVRGARGRIAVCEAGSGDLVAALTEAGLDAYGVEPRFELADAAVARGLEMRADEATGHLRSVTPGDLDAVVLRGCVERRATGELLELVDLVASRLAPGGRIVVCSVSPQAWGRVRTEVEADLALGRPLHASTWQSVLAARHFTGIALHPCGSADPLEALPAGHPDAAVLNDNLARISGLLFAPDAFVVVAARPPGS